MTGYRIGVIHGDAKIWRLWNVRQEKSITFMGDAVSREIKALWGKVWLAINRAIALGIFILVHFGLNKAIKAVVPNTPTLAKGEILLESILFVFFALIYVRLGWDMLRVFFPILREERKKLQPPEAFGLTQEQENE